MSDEDEIRALLKMYESSLSHSDAELAAACYASDGVFMPTGRPTIANGGMREGYAETFASIRLSVTFTIDELVVANDLRPGTCHER